MLNALTQSPWVERTGWVLVHSLWQFALVVLLAAALQWALRRRTAATRYVTLLAAMSIVVALPAVTWFAIGPIKRPARAGVPASAGLSEKSRLKAELQCGEFPPPQAASGETPLPLPKPSDVQPVEIAESPPPALVREESALVAPLAWWSSLKTRVEPWLPAIVLVWIAGVAVFAFRLLASWYTVRRLRTVGVSPVAEAIREMLARTAKRLRLARAVGVLQSTLVKTPLVIGYFRPLVLLPLCVVTGLPESQLELILAHELAHIRRHDYLVNLLQTLVETLFFYHPAVWWLSRQIRHERENCCDDVAISLSGSRADYGRALLAIEELRAAAPALSLAAGGGRLLARIRRIAGQQRTPRAAGGIVLAAIVVPVAILALVLWGSAPAAEKPKADDQSDKTAASDSDSSDAESEPATTLDSILKRLAEEEKRYNQLDVSATTTYQDLSKDTSRGSGGGQDGAHNCAVGGSVIVRDEVHERSVVAGGRMYYEKAGQAHDEEGKQTSSLMRRAFDGQWSRGYEQWTDAEPGRRDSASIRLGQGDVPLLRGHTLLFHNEFGIKGQLLSAYLGSGWSDADEQYAMTVEYLGDEQTDGLACYKLKCAVPMHGKVDLYFLLWLARERNLLPVRREWHENRISMTLPTGVERVTKLRELRPGQWFPMEATDISYKERLRKGEVAVQWRSDVRIDKVSLAAPADVKLFSSVEAPKGTSISVEDRSGKRIGEFKQPRTGNIEISLDRFHAMQRAAATNEEDEYDPKDATAPKRKQRIDAAYAVLRADPPLAQKDRIEAALTILQNFGIFQTNTKKWATAIRELITIGKPALPRLIDELDHIDRAARPETELRALGFVLRGIGDARAVPALIRALPYSLQPPRSDFAAFVDDADLMAFMRQHDNDNGSSAKRFYFGRPINELLPALQKLTGIVAILPTEDGGKEFGRIRDVVRGGNADEVRDQRKLFLRFAERWAGWWAKNWKQYVSEEKDAQLDQTQAALERDAQGTTALPTKAKILAVSPKAQPVALRIECKTPTFKVAQEIDITIWIKNLTAKELSASDTYWSARVIVDGKEYKRPDDSVGPWGGPGSISPKGELQIGFVLSGFIDTKKVLTVGKHTLAIKIGDAVSDTVSTTALAAPEPAAPKVSDPAGNTSAAKPADALGTHEWLPAYPMLGYPRFQDPLELTPEQKEKLVEISFASAKDATEIAKETAGLPRDKLQARWTAVWEEHQKQRRESIEKLLTPQQLETYKNLAFPQMAFRELMVPGMRTFIGITPDQQKRLAEMPKTLLAESTKRRMQRTERLLALLTEQQREQLRAKVERQQAEDFDAQTVNVWVLGAPIDRRMIPPILPFYSELWTPSLSGPVALSAEQKKRLDEIARRYWNQRDDFDGKRRQLAPGEWARREAEFRQAAAQINRDARDSVEAVLTPEQSAAVKEITFQRDAQGKLTWFRAELGLSQGQEASIAQINQEAANEAGSLYQDLADRQLAIFTAQQQQKLRELLDRHGW